MGCTSSASNMPEIITNTTDTTEHEHDNDVITKDIQHEVEIIQKTTENDANVSKIEVLPTCDRLEENIQLARDSNSFTNIINEEQEDDKQLPSAIEEENRTENEEHSEENKFSTLKEVADKVLLNNILEEIDNTSTSAQEEPTNKDNNCVDETVENFTDSIEIPPLPYHSNDEELEDVEDEEHVEESASPSQSDGSRSTRWEALADIAAELPPSLAVDPITGQIYSLTK